MTLKIKHSGGPLLIHLLAMVLVETIRDTVKKLSPILQKENQDTGKAINSDQWKFSKEGKSNQYQTLSLNTQGELTKYRKSIPLIPRGYEHYSFYVNQL